MKKIFCFVILSLLCINAMAQVTVKGKLDSLHIVIGDQIGLSIGVTAPEKSKIVFPDLKEDDYIVPGVEIVEITDDTVKNNNNNTITRRYQLTSFDPDHYVIPAETINVAGKNYRTNELKFEVSDFPVDTLKLDSFNLEKDYMDVPFSWAADWSQPFWLACLVIPLLLIVAFLFIRRKQNKPIISRAIIVKHVPPHQKAMQAIDRIKQDRISLSENQKAYYTMLTDTLRQYIQERFGFSAMEMTTDEIIEHLRENSDQTMIDELHELFETADLVKFAKFSTLINENDRNLVNAISFIDKTKRLDDKPRSEKIAPKLSEDEKINKNSRIVVTVLLAIFSLAAVSLLGYVCYELYELIF